MQTPIESQPKVARKRVAKSSVVSATIPSIVRSIADAVVVKDRNLFFLSRRDGGVPLIQPHGFGLYFNDCRYLNGYTLELGGTRPQALVSNASLGFSAVHQLSNEEFIGLDERPIGKETLGVRWKRTIDSKHLVLADSILFQNFSLEPMHFEASLFFDSQFEDIFSVRGLLPQNADAREVRWLGRSLSFEQRGADGITRSVTIDFFPSPEEVDGSVAHFRINIAAQTNQELIVTLGIREQTADALSSPWAPKEPDFGQIEKRVERERTEWLTKEASVQSDSLSLNRTLHRSLLDLKMLESSLDGHLYFSAGVPWFATLFGRDSLITAIQTLAYNPSIAAQTLRLLAKYQGKEISHWRDEGPGKILHELRVGEFAKMGKIPHTPYYGSVDATPLFLILLYRHALWTGNLDLFNSLRSVVDRALEWIEQQTQGEGYLRYSSQSEMGLTNQGWKDSWDGIMNHDGSLVASPVALVEVQAYVFEAKIGIASLLERAGDLERARELREEASNLRRKFDEDFWIDEKRSYAMALHGEKKQQAVVMASNQGHAMWSGIVDNKKAPYVVQRLMEPDMFSGWGIRTLSENEKRYNPLGYHLGTVWPHDNSMIAAGFKRYGFESALLKIFNGIFRSSIHFDHQRLPELFAGFSEKDYGVPVHYPVACHPQAWAAGTVPYLMESLLGLQPAAFEKKLRIIHPVLPEFVDQLEFRRLRVGEATVDLGFSRTARGSVAVDVLKAVGEIDVVVEPAPATN